MLEQATFALHVVAMVLAVAVTRRRPEHRPVAAFLGAGVFANTIRLLIKLYVLTPARESMRAVGLDPVAVPFAGWTRAAFHVESALFVGWSAGLAALALWVLLRRRPWPIALAWMAVVAALVLTYPVARGAVLREWYLGVHLVSLTVATGCLVMWFARLPRPTLPTMVTGFLIGTELISLAVGPWRGSLFSTWDFAQAAYSTLYVAISILQGGALWFTPTRSPQ